MGIIRVGDICVIVYMDRHPELIGRECEVVLPEGPKQILLQSGQTITQVGFGVYVPGWRSRLFPHRLRPLIGMPRAWLRKRGLPNGEEEEESGAGHQQRRSVCEPA